MLYPLQTSVLKSEGGGLAEGNTQVGGEPSQKQTTLLSLLNQQHGSCSLEPRKGRYGRKMEYFHHVHRKHPHQPAAGPGRGEHCAMKRAGGLHQR